MNRIPYSIPRSALTRCFRLGLTFILYTCPCLQALARSEASRALEHAAGEKAAAAAAEAAALEAVKEAEAAEVYIYTFVYKHIIYRHAYIGLTLNPAEGGTHIYMCIHI